MLPLTLREIAVALRGEVAGRQVLAPGPGHSRKDRSLSVQLSPSAPGGFLVFSHAGDDWRACRDYVAQALGYAGDWWRGEEVDEAELQRRAEARERAELRHAAETARRQRFALGMWNEAGDPAGTIVEAYLNSRALDLPRDITGAVLRFHPRCPWEQGTMPAMVAAVRDVRTGAIIGVHRTALTPEGRKLGRKIFGTAAGGAVMLDPLDAIGPTLTVGEGIETCLAARQVGLAPVWSLVSSSNLGTLPVLDEVSRITVLAEVDTSPTRPSATACAKIGARWDAARRTVDFLYPPEGAKDFNDALMMGGAV
ncbi:DUF7146 domain-containing protein [Methylobacterium organophilum]|uniref:Toprim domain-containing protein n=1 Tax=Methylobacterium organophilum TaxID=410 RepID=A0ABQ4TGS0_METOR|nr:toprim domain-containing protein [Methylobacterium organophilum]GJE29529.1 hypothetical protein LKMONMHP_4411 [Methylobacterium organophilum]